MELEDQIGRADVIDEPSGTSVKFGATVTLVDEDTDAEPGIDRGYGNPDAKRGAAFRPRPSPAP